MGNVRVIACLLFCTPGEEGEEWEKITRKHNKKLSTMLLSLQRSLSLLPSLPFSVSSLSFFISLSLSLFLSTHTNTHTHTHTHTHRKLMPRTTALPSTVS